MSKDRGGLSPNCQIQTDEALEYADASGYEVMVEYQENDVSASKFSKQPRPLYDELIERIRANEIEVVLATEMTRLYRQLPQLLELIKLAETTDLKRIETTDGAIFLLHTGEGIHAAISAVNNAMLESRKISDRGKRKKKAQAKLGLPGGGDRSYGYNLGHMTVKEVEAANIRDWADRVIGGESVSSITADINRLGIKTTRGNDWKRNRVTSMLVNPRYIGIRKHLNDEYPAQWPAILTRQVHDRLKLELRARQGQRQRLGGPRRYLLIGFAICGLCGNKLHCSQKRRDKTQQLKPTYTCRGKDNREIRVGCDGISRNGLALEHYVIEQVLDRLTSHGMAQAIAAFEGDDTRLSDLMIDVEQRTKHLNGLVDDYGSGLLTRDQLARAKASAEEALHTAQSLLDKESRSRTVMDLPLADELRGAWDDADLEWRRALLAMMIDKVIVNRQLKRPFYFDFGRFDPAAIEIVWR